MTFTQSSRQKYVDLGGLAEVEDIPRSAILTDVFWSRLHESSNEDNEKK